MTTEERLNRVDDKLDAILKAVIQVQPKVDAHDLTLFGDGSDGNHGLKENFAILYREHSRCSVCSTEGKKMTLSTVMMFIAIASLLTSVVIGYATLKRDTCKIDSHQGTDMTGHP